MSTEWPRAGATGPGATTSTRLLVLLALAGLAGGVRWYVQRDGSGGERPAAPATASTAPAEPTPAAAPVRAPAPSRAAGQRSRVRRLPGTAAGLADAIRAAGWSDAPGRFVGGGPRAERGRARGAIQYGGGGDDVLVGSRAVDWFLFADDASVGASAGGVLGRGPGPGPRDPMGVDTIERFEPGRDRIALATWTFRDLLSPLGGGLSDRYDFALVASDEELAALAARGADRPRIVYDTTSGNLYYLGDARGLGLGPNGHFATLAGAPRIGRSDFRIVGAVDAAAPPAPPR